MEITAQSYSKSLVDKIQSTMKVLSLTLIVLFAAVSNGQRGPNIYRHMLFSGQEEPSCEGTECAAGCCAEENWFCCADEMYCAATEANCPFDKKHLTPAMDPESPCPGTECVYGCCTESGWFCCPDKTCASDKQYCGGCVHEVMPQQ